MVCLSLVLGLAAVAPAAPRGPESRRDVPAVIGHRQAVIVGPQGTPFNMPSDAAVGRDGSLYILDGVNHRVVVCDGEGRFQFQFGNRGGGPGQLAYPLGIATDPNGNIYVADSGNHRFQIFAAGGKPVEAVPLPASASGVPPDPTDVAVDPARNGSTLPTTTIT